MSTDSSVYATDAPIVDPAQDGFQRWPFAERIADTIAAHADPSSMVIAVYGAWGQGKTTVLNFIHKALQAKDGVVPIQYNPWRFGTEEQLLAGFFGLLGDTLNRSLKTQKEKICTMVADYSRLLAPISEHAERTGNLAAQAANIGLDELKTRVGQILVEEKKKVVVLIDDIDRLDKSEIHAVFRLVKLSADFANVVYVLAFDHDVVAASLGERYGGGDLAAGTSFLEKIIQVPLDLPLVNQEALRRYAFACLDQAVKVLPTELTEAQAQEFGRHYIQGIEPRMTTPRVCKRYANALSFALGILRDEVNPVDLMVLEALRMLYPGLHKVIRAHKEFIFASGESARAGDGAKRFQEDVASSLERLGHDAREAAHSLIQALLPQVADLFGGMGHDQAHWEPEWYKAKRAASRAYFDRYFSYAIPGGDIPDRPVADLLASLPDASADAVQETLAHLAEKYGAEPLVAKLRASEDTLPGECPATLATAMVRIGSDFPRPDVWLPFVTPFAQAGILVANLVRNVPRDSRSALACELVAGAGSIPFALELTRWMRADEDEKRDDATHNDFDLKLGGIVAQRIEDESKKCDLLAEYGGDLKSMLWTWNEFGDRNSCRSYAIKWLDDAPRVPKLLQAHAASAWTDSRKLRGVFGRDQYDAVTAIFDAERVIEALRAIYGDALDDPRDEFAAFTDDEEWVAHQFCRMHRQAGHDNSAAQGDESPGEAPASGAGAPASAGSTPPGGVPSPKDKRLPDASE